MIEPVLAKRIQLVGVDVDGTMTDGGIYLGAAANTLGTTQPVELKRFDIQDGIGMVLLKAAGLVVVMSTGRPGEAARLRAQELGVDAFLVDPSARKLTSFEAVLHKYNTRWEETAFVGDDLPDLPILQRVGLPVAVANAAAEVKEIAAHTTKAPGGHGAIREFVETFLKARGTWTDVVRAYLKERSDVALAR
jgi:3-deoxy-D-manno-octulosonate 8-phosphate phosphatase (KDO 8-P phosphatase)